MKETQSVDTAQHAEEALKSLAAATEQYIADKPHDGEKFRQINTEIVLLEAQLREKIAEREKEIALGTALDRFDRAIAKAELAVRSVLDWHSREVSDQLAVERYGQAISEVAADARQELRNHIRVTGLRAFFLGGRPSTNGRAVAGTIVWDKYTEEYLTTRAAEVAEKLTALKTHIEQERSKYAANTK
jgi:hypothetical protein